MLLSGSRVEDGGGRKRLMARVSAERIERLRSFTLTPSLAVGNVTPRHFYSKILYVITILR